MGLPYGWIRLPARTVLAGSFVDFIHVVLPNRVQAVRLPYVLQAHVVVVPKNFVSQLGYIATKGDLTIPANSRCEPQVITGVSFGWFDLMPLGNINIPSVVMKMLYFDPWEFRPFFKLFFRGFFDEKSDESDFPEYPYSSIVKVVSPVRPDDSVN